MTNISSYYHHSINISILIYIYTHVSFEMFEDANPDISKEMATIGGEDLLVDNANQQDYFQAWTNSFDSVALMEPGALQVNDGSAYFTPFQIHQNYRTV